MDLKQLEVNKDYRGTFIEAFKLPNDGQISYIIINPGEARGNHYHKRKTEHFLVMYGSATMTVKNRETGDTLSAEVSGYKPIIITVTPDHTHQIVATDEGAIVLVWCDEIFNKKDSDTYPEEI